MGEFLLTNSSSLLAPVCLKNARPLEGGSSCVWSLGSGSRWFLVWLGPGFAGLWLGF
jgi:hypothetical protein